MHIPDGYLSPQTCAVLGAAMVPVWYTASRKVEKKLPFRHVPLLAMSAAFAFVMQMFNVPIPDGTTAHVVGGVLIAVVLGPWPAVIAMTITLVIQSLFFGDGGITALGANVFNMAFVGPFVGYGVYRLLGAGSQSSAQRRVVAASVGAFFGANASALLTGIELGLQPMFFKTAEGVPLYSPYGLAQALPAMIGTHLLIVGPLEAIVTGLAVAYLQRANLGLFAVAQRSSGAPSAPRGTSRRWLWGTAAILLLLAIVSPIGSLAAGTAWGEWGIEELETTLGFVPGGLHAVSGLWSGVLSDYNVPGWESEWLSRLGYLISAVVGIGIIGVVSMLLGRVLLGRDRRHGHS